jgi:hypothetical protein
VVSADVPNAKIILTTLHGAGYGLDESEAFMSLLFGFKDYFLNFTETAVEEIVFVELNSTRSGRLKNLVRMVLPDGQLISAEGDGVAERRSTFANLYQSSQKPDRSKNSIFVAMPFANEMDDVYHYAISGAAHKCGFICERADMVHFTGEIIAWMRQRIEVADYVIADLTGANANVYLEIGYAWGCQKPTILLLKEGHEVKFDVQGHRYIKYSSIHELEKKLSETLKAMSA